MSRQAASSGCISAWVLFYHGFITMFYRTEAVVECVLSAGSLRCQATRRSCPCKGLRLDFYCSLIAAQQVRECWFIRDLMTKSYCNKVSRNHMENVPSCIRLNSIWWYVNLFKKLFRFVSVVMYIKGVMKTNSSRVVGLRRISSSHRWLLVPKVESICEKKVSSTR